MAPDSRGGERVRPVRRLGNVSLLCPILGFVVGEASFFQLKSMGRPFTVMVSWPVSDQDRIPGMRRRRRGQWTAE